MLTRRDRALYLPQTVRGWVILAAGILACLGQVLVQIPPTQGGAFAGWLIILPTVADLLTGWRAFLSLGGRLSRWPWWAKVLIAPAFVLGLMPPVYVVTCALDARRRRRVERAALPGRIEALERDLGIGGTSSSSSPATSAPDDPAPTIASERPPSEPAPPPARLPASHPAVAYPDADRPGAYTARVSTTKTPAPPRAHVEHAPIRALPTEWARSSPRPPRFKIWPRYRRPSLSTLLGITRAKRRLGKASGYYAATRWLRAPRNFHRRMLRRAGYYSEPMKLARWLFRNH